ncbi:PLD nuclease N-terminal domain-containing protein [Microbacterium jejuense]|uniref:PLD nuclease N-terminal domain-containing protein n=1 Tax=Microbacterium jejuense TaxID=1263637 RepID=UPI0031EAA111
MPVLISLVFLAIMIAALVDIIRRDEAQLRYLPKMGWVIVVILLPLIGTLLWFTIGRVYPEDRPRGVRAPRPAAAAPSPAMPRDTRTTEQQLADLEREIEEDRLRAELDRRRRARDARESGA